LFFAASKRPPQPEHFKPKATDPNSNKNDARDRRAGDGTQPFMDRASYDALEFDDVVASLDTARLNLGRCALVRSLVCPPLDAQTVRDRQDALEELANRPDLRLELESAIDRAAKFESSVNDLAWGEFGGLVDFSDAASGTTTRAGFGHSAIKRVRLMLKELLKALENAPQPESAYLRSLFADISEIANSRYFQLLTAGYISECGPLTMEEKKKIILAYRFRPTFFKPMLLAGLALGVVGLSQYVASTYGGAGPGMVGGFYLFGFWAMVPLTAAYIAIVGKIDRDSFILPAGRTLLKDGKAKAGFEALAQLDVLLSHHRNLEALDGAPSLPEIRDEANHQITMNGLRSPLIGRDRNAYVTNDVALLEARITFLTGPNSGGKTALAKALMHSQILGQAGCYVPASSGCLVPADRIFYQIPLAGSLKQAEGRFATELSRTRDIFFAATERSFAVLDEPFEGTSFDERIAISRDVVDGFLKLKATLILITHNHELARQYRGAGVGGAAQFLEAIFEGDDATFRFETGIAETSRASQVARDISFSRTDIKRHLGVNK